MTQPIFHGIYTPSVTITDGHGFDFPAWGKHLQNLISAGVDGILLFGSIGEFFTFSAAERSRATDWAVDVIAGRAKLLVGVGGTDIREVVALAGHAQAARADGVLVLSPYYFGPSQAAALRWFGAVADEIDTNVLLYNFPDRTGNDLDADLVATLATRHRNIVGIKDTVDTISHTRQIADVVKSDLPGFAVFSGFDEYYLLNRLSGGDGIISGLTNIFPELFVRMHLAYEGGDYGDALSAARRVAKLMSIYNVGDLFVGTIKAAVHERGLDFDPDDPRTGIPLTSLERERLQTILRDYGS